MQTSKQPEHRKKKNRQNYKRNKKRKKTQKMKELVAKIKEENIVVNLSNEEIPACAYMFLAKGIGFVQSQKANIHDMRYDTFEFIRKLKWRAFFHQNEEGESTGTVNTTPPPPPPPPPPQHGDIRISNFSNAPFQHPIIDELELKLLGWIANYDAKAPKSNLTACELRGRKWVKEKISSKSIFVTKADKGGAILIMNYADTEEAIEKELFDENKFTEIQSTADKHLSTVRGKINKTTIDLQQKKKISNDDKTLITGLTEKNNAKQAPEYRAVSPYTYPSFKVHKLSKEEIEQKKVPPARLIHASKHSPLYRMEKWTSPFLTNMSRRYCENEYILDTKDFLNAIDELNNTNTLQNENFNLFTIDVAKLYPSIQPHLAEEAVNDLLANIDEEEVDVAEAVKTFVKLSFEESYVTYKDRVFKPKVGIPTGGSLSRQIADTFLHWLLFKKIDQTIFTAAELKFLKRFIDDGFGIWKGTKRTFVSWLKKLNNETNKYGINFPLEESQFGKSVNFLDVTLFIDQNNNIQYKSYNKPTDAKRYLRPQSFHPKSVFESVPYSQIIRTREHNSTEETMLSELQKMKEDFKKSGYDERELDRIERRAMNETNRERTRNKEDTITFPIFYFEDLNSYKAILKDSAADIQQLIGDTKIVMAVKKNPSLGNQFIQNKSLSEEKIQLENQRCNTTNCHQCPLVNTSNTTKVNNIHIPTPKTLNCKSRNILYLWQCQLCNEDDSYIGRTIQESHKRTNTHRGCFADGNKWEGSALSMHAKEKHGENVSLNNFKISLVKKCSPQRIRREEFKLIDRYKTRTRGMNRYKN